MTTLIRPARRPRRDAATLPGALAARAVNAVPDRVADRLVRPRSSDGQLLSPHMHFALLLQRLAEARPTRDPKVLRVSHRRAALGVGGRTIPVHKVTDVRFDGPAGPLTGRLYEPAERITGQGGLRPLLVYYHGGGFVVGDLDTADGICRLLCAQAGVSVFSVDYRLAPEHPAPAAVEDADAAFQWAQARAERLGCDPRRVAVGGDSAGGTLAAVVSQRAVARRRTDPAAAVPALQFLIYPSTHHLSDFPSRRSFGTGYFLEQTDMDWFFDCYVLRGGWTGAEPEISPLLVEDLTNFPPALVVTAAFDPLRDEAEAYAARLADAGVPVVLRRAPGMLHGFFHMTGFSRAARDAAVSTAGALSALLETQPA